MPKKKVKIQTKDGPAEAEEVVLPEITGEAKKAEPKGEVVSVTGPHADVHDASGHFARSFTKALHGAKFVEIAKGYAKKIGGTVR